MDGKFFLRLVTAENPYFEGECIELKFPAKDGLVGIRINHAPYVFEVGIGVAEIMLDDAEIIKFAVQNGFVQVENNKVTLIAEQVQTPDKISFDDVKTKLKNCLKQLTDFDDTLDRKKLEQEFNWLKALSKLNSTK